MLRPAMIRRLASTAHVPPFSVNAKMAKLESCIANNKLRPAPWPKSFWEEHRQLLSAVSCQMQTLDPSRLERFLVSVLSVPRDNALPEPFTLNLVDYAIKHCDEKANMPLFLRMCGVLSRTAPNILNKARQELVYKLIQTKLSGGPDQFTYVSTSDIFLLYDLLASKSGQTIPNKEKLFGILEAVLTDKSIQNRVAIKLYALFLAHQKDIWSKKFVDELELRIISNLRILVDTELDELIKTLVNASSCKPDYYPYAKLVGDAPKIAAEFLNRMAYSFSDYGMVYQYIQLLQLAKVQNWIALLCKALPTIHTLPAEDVLQIISIMGSTNIVDGPIYLKLGNCLLAAMNAHANDKTKDASKRYTALLQGLQGYVQMSCQHEKYLVKTYNSEMLMKACKLLREVKRELEQKERPVEESQQVENQSILGKIQDIFNKWNLPPPI